MIVEGGGRHLLLLWLRLRLVRVTGHGGGDLGSSRWCGKRWLRDGGGEVGRGRRWRGRNLCLYLLGDYWWLSLLSEARC